MKVQHLLDALSKLAPDEDICALLYTKKDFDFPEEDDLVLTNEGWEKLCNDFDDTPFLDVYDVLSNGALFYADERNG